MDDIFQAGEYHIKLSDISGISKLFRPNPYNDDNHFFVYLNGCKAKIYGSGGFGKSAYDLRNKLIDRWNEYLSTPIKYHSIKHN